MLAFYNLQIFFFKMSLIFHQWFGKTFSNQQFTTNSCETFHKKLNSLFNSFHLNIFNFVVLLKNIQFDTCILLQNQGIRHKITTEKEAYGKKKNERSRKKKQNN